MTSFMNPKWEQSKHLSMTNGTQKVPNVYFMSLLEFCFVVIFTIFGDLDIWEVISNS